MKNALLLLKNILFVTLVVAQVPCLGSSLPLWSVEEAMVYQKKEVINGKTFIYREDMVNGTMKKKWAIDGVIVGENEYIDAIVLAEQEVRKQVRKQEQLSREKQYQERHTTTVALYKKLLKAKYDEITTHVQQIQVPQLQPFLVFNEQHSVSQEAFGRLNETLLPAIEALLASQEEHDIQEYKTLLAQADEIPTQLHDMFNATVNNAINVCNDTRMLKELLELVCKA